MCELWFEFAHKRTITAVKCSQTGGRGDVCGSRVQHTDRLDLQDILLCSARSENNSDLIVNSERQLLKGTREVNWHYSNLYRLTGGKETSRAVQFGHMRQHVFSVVGYS
jgi:hypothetical protein